MTRGEYPLSTYKDECNNNSFANSELLNPVNYNQIYKQNKGEAFGENVDENENKKLNSCCRDIENNNSQIEHINIAEYVQQLPSSLLRQKIARVLSTDADDESEIDIENIQHFLLIGRSTNSNRILKCCENKLLLNLSSENCDSYFELAEQFDLHDLKRATSVIIENRNGNNIQATALNAVSQTSPTTKKTYKNYNALFTCGTSRTKRTVTVVVLDSNMKVKSYKDLKKGTKISKTYQCCCQQSDDDEAPMVYWSYGKSVYSYDPVMNKCKKRASLVCKRSNFCMLTHSNYCFVIGGVYKGRKVLEIEELGHERHRNSWKIVARLPGDCLPIDASCVVYEDLIYIFSAILTIEGTIKPQATAVYIFHPKTKTVKSLSEIPISFHQMKTCVHESFIYLASDQKHLIKYSPRDGTFIQCKEQPIQCKDFGMFSLENAIVLAGGTNRDRECTDVIRTFCTTSGQWKNHSQNLPDSMAISGAIEIKIPKSYEMIVPFYENNIFEKRL